MFSVIIINDFKRLSAQSGRISLSQGYHSVSQDITQSGRISLIQVGYHSFKQDITYSSRLSLNQAGILLNKQNITLPGRDIWLRCYPVSWSSSAWAATLMDFLPPLSLAAALESTTMVWSMFTMTLWQIPVKFWQSMVASQVNILNLTWCMFQIFMIYLLFIEAYGF